MISRVMHRITALLTGMAVLLGGVMLSSDLQAVSAASPKPDLGRGYLKTEFKYDPDMKESPKPDYSRRYKGSAAYRGYEDTYSTNVIYNRLSSAARELWDELDSQSYEALTTGKNYDEGRFDVAYYSNLSEDDAYYTALIFRLSNPQYFFLNNVVYYGSINGKPCVQLCLFSDFTNGSARLAAWQRMESTAKSYISIAEQYSGTVDRLVSLQQQLCENVVYDDYAADNPNRDDPLDQSAYSAFCMGLTVCAGYSQAMSLLCNAMGIDCFSVTSDSHQWNCVRVDDNWYNVDVTAADGYNEGVFYYYFMKSDIDYRMDRMGNGSAHLKESMWRNLIRSCVLSAEGDDYWTPGTIPTVSERTNAPSIEVGSNGVASITGFDSGVRIFYTLDGSDPSEASTKCDYYTGAFGVNDGAVIRAIAVKDGLLDSDVTEKAASAGSSSTVTPTPTPVPTPTPTPDPTPSPVTTTTPDPVTDTTGTTQPEETTEPEGTVDISAIKTQWGTVSKVTAGRRSLTVKLVRNLTSEATVHYQIRYRTGSGSWKSKYTTKTTIKLTGLKKKKKYQIKVRPYIVVDGKKYYGQWSQTVKKTTK